MDEILRNLSSTLHCPECSSLDVNYEANDNLQIISFSCGDCNWQVSTSYRAARQVGFEPTGGYFDTTVILLNEEGEITRQFKTKF